MSGDELLTTLVRDMQKQLLDSSLSLGELHGRIRAQEHGQLVHGNSISELGVMVRNLKTEFDMFRTTVEVSWKWAVGSAIVVSSVVGPAISFLLSKLFH